MNHPDPELQARVADLLGRAVVGIAPLSGGQVGQVRRLQLDDGSAVVAKTMTLQTEGFLTEAPAADLHPPPTPLQIEAAMLEHLRRHSRLPVPMVLHAGADLLLLEHLPGSTRQTPASSGHLAELLADLHDRVAPRFGFEYPTLIGPYPQDNTPGGDWGVFFLERRLRPMTEIATRSGHLPADVRTRIQRLESRVPQLLAHQPAPALLHGDLWAGNVLVADGRVSGVIDPALSWGDPETELAYIDLFDSFGGAFFERYRELREVPEGFWRERRWLYQLYPLLVHVAFFGTRGYVEMVGERVGRLGW